MGVVGNYVPRRVISDRFSNHAPPVVHIRAIVWVWIRVGLTISPPAPDLYVGATNSCLRLWILN
eukprot:1352349-Amorphochlora_amoeboformis.AAC.1